MSVVVSFVCWTYVIIICLGRFVSVWAIGFEFLLFHSAEQVGWRLRKETEEI